MARVFYGVAGMVQVAGVPMAPRPRRLAAGMTATWQRSMVAGSKHVLGITACVLPAKFRREGGRIALTLATRGTLDALQPYAGRGAASVIERAPCPCCGGHRNVVRLTSEGRMRLLYARQRAAFGLAPRIRPVLP